MCVFNVSSRLCARYDTANRTAGGDVQLSGALTKIGLCRPVMYRSKTLRDKTAANRGYVFTIKHRERKRKCKTTVFNIHHQLVNLSISFTTLHKL